MRLETNGWITTRVHLHGSACWCSVPVLKSYDAWAGNLNHVQLCGWGVPSLPSPPKLLSDVVYILTLAFHLHLTQENIGNHTVIESNRAHYHLVLENNIWSTKSVMITVYRITCHTFLRFTRSPAFSLLFCRNTAFIY